MTYVHPQSWYHANTREPLNHATAKPLIQDMLGSENFVSDSDGSMFHFPLAPSFNTQGLYQIVGKNLSAFLNSVGIQCNYQPGGLVFNGHTRESLAFVLTQTYAEKASQEAGLLQAMDKMRL